MENLYGQDIQPGDYVGLGQRSGNGTETRVGRVLQITVIPGSSFSTIGQSGALPKAKALVLWEEELASRADDGYTYQSMIDFWKLFLIDGASLRPRIKRHLDVKHDSIVAP